MKIFCEKCSREIDALDSYCPYCGSRSPDKTVLATEYENWDGGHFCPSCGKKGPKDGLYCGGCGESLFKKPEKEMFCPVCAEKNKVQANSCFACRCSFRQWFELRGDAAEKAGYKGDLVVKEKMTGITYRFIQTDFFRIGRSPENDMSVPCAFVSGNHMMIDMKNYKLRDFQSSNNTYINRKPDPVTEVELGIVNEIALAGSFVFTVTKKENGVILKLSAILDEEECIANGDAEAFERLRKECIILLSGKKESFYIRKEDGKVKKDPEKGREFYTIDFENGYYYYSDESRGLKKLLLFKSLDNWPVNWSFGDTILN